MSSKYSFSQNTIKFEQVITVGDKIDTLKVCVFYDDGLYHICLDR